MHKKINHPSIVRVLVLTVVLILQVAVFPEDTNAGVDCWTMYMMTREDVQVTFICYLGGGVYVECPYICDADVFSIDCDETPLLPDECYMLFNVIIFHNCEPADDTCNNLYCLDFNKNYTIGIYCRDGCSLCD